MAIYAKVRRMRLCEGLSISEIARRTSLSRNTIKAWLRDPVRSEMAYRREAGPKKLDGHIEWLLRAVETDVRRPRKERRTALFLYTQLQAQGFTGSYSRVTEPIRAWRAEAGTVAARLRPAAVRVGRGVPVRLERGRDRDRRRLAQDPTGTHEALCLASVLAGGVSGAEPRDAVRCTPALPNGSGRHCPARDLRRHEDGSGLLAGPRQGTDRQRPFCRDDRALSDRFGLLQRGQRLEEGARREKRPGQPAADLAGRVGTMVFQFRRAQRLAGHALHRGTPRGAPGAPGHDGTGTRAGPPDADARALRWLHRAADTGIEQVPDDCGTQPLLGPLCLGRASGQRAAVSRAGDRRGRAASGCRASPRHRPRLCGVRLAALCAVGRAQAGGATQRRTLSRRCRTR